MLSRTRRKLDGVKWVKEEIKKKKEEEERKKKAIKIYVKENKEKNLLKVHCMGVDSS